MRRAVFLDRDGVLIRNVHYGCDPDAIQLLSGVPQGLRLLREQGYLLIVVTNQSGVARGYFTEGQLEAMHMRLGEMLMDVGAAIDGFYYCPHHPGGVVPAYTVICDCRKPRPGMILRACADFGIEVASSWLIGDILDDVEAGNRAGCRSILLDVGSESAPESPERMPEYVATDFLDAVHHLLTQHQGSERVRKLGGEEVRKRRGTDPGSLPRPIASWPSAARREGVRRRG